MTKKKICHNQNNYIHRFTPHTDGIVRITLFALNAMYHENIETNKVK